MSIIIIQAPTPTPATLAMADKNTEPMAANERQIRVVTEESNPLQLADKLWMFFSKLKASPTDFFPSKFNTASNPKKMIIFQFMNKHLRDKALGLEKFDEALASCKFTLNDTSNSNTDHRTVFVNRLPACLFYFFDPDTLEDAIVTFKTVLKSQVPNIDKIHLIRHPNPDSTLQKPNSKMNRGLYI